MLHKNKKAHIKAILYHNTTKKYQRELYKYRVYNHVIIVKCVYKYVIVFIQYYFLVFIHLNECM